MNNDIEEMIRLNEYCKGCDLQLNLTDRPITKFCLLRVYSKQENCPCYKCLVKVMCINERYECNMWELCVDEYIKPGAIISTNKWIKVIKEHRS